MEKVKKDVGILWICHHCGSFNLETLDWIKRSPTETECVICGSIIKI